METKAANPGPSNPRSPKFYSHVHTQVWERIKNLDFPDGYVAIRDSKGKPVIHRQNTRRQLREMARLATRRKIREECARAKEVLLKAARKEKPDGPVAA